MYDDLDRIESVYGSVAEYYRVQYEERYMDHDMDDHEDIERMIENEISMKIYNEQIRVLDGEPSDIAEALRHKWDEKFIEISEESGFDYTKLNYAIRDFSHDKVLDIFDRICEHYEIISDEKWDSFYRPGVGMFGISVPYSDGCQIFHKNIGCLDYDLFQQVFRDLEYTGLCPSMSYEQTEGKPIILSNCSLGSIRIYDLRLAGLETETSINRELTEKGFNEQEVIDSVIESHGITMESLMKKYGLYTGDSVRAGGEHYLIIRNYNGECEVIRVVRDIKKDSETVYRGDYNECLEWLEGIKNTNDYDLNL